MSFDVIVIGGGHAGCEAAAASARTGASTLLVTFTRNSIGAMSCNPAIGGIGKGHLVREVDAFDGLIGVAADDAAIHYRMLNASKGAAVRGPRVQADRRLFAQSVQRRISAQANLTVIDDEVVELIFVGGRIAGVGLRDAKAIAARSIVIATGTFLNARIFRGEAVDAGGRVGEAASNSLGDQLRELSLPISRLKTGTPPRLDGRTIDWFRLAIQASDRLTWTMSPMTTTRRNPQLACGIARTNSHTHDLIRAAMDRSPLRSGAIEGQGPRYCPSIEDKVSRFGDRDGHQIFLEPEGLDSALVYPNGISTSLPLDAQCAFVRSVEGLEAVEIVQPGYAVEYDFIDPRALEATLGLRDVPGLYLAGQVNGTTGYEEAAAQGLVAGVNAAAFAHDRAPLVMDRADSYIGVMIDDLTLQGVSEPYRMLTARAEYRLRLRSDNAETRLSEIAANHKCVGPERRLAVARRAEARNKLSAALDTVAPGSAFSKTSANDDGARRTLREWLRVASIGSADILAVAPAFADAEPDIVDELVEDARYAPYVARQDAEIKALRASGEAALPFDIDYGSVPGLSTEMIERLNTARPADIAAARRIRGITPAALAIILVHAQRRKAA